jgi:predicted ATPase
MRYDAVKFFVDRACAARANFRFTIDNAQTISEICAQVDGLPLAIELAAARMKVLSPQEILKRLDKRLNLLTGGAIDLPMRLRTMRGALDWSYDLLTQSEKRLFCRLGVFAGSFSLDSAECINQEPSGERQVLDILTSLLDQSLLSMEQPTGSDVRFRMLGVVREYALHRLEETGETGAIGRIHAEHFLELAEAAEPALQGTQPGTWLNRLEEEYDNLREALHWSMTNDFAMAVRFNVALRYYWDFMGQLAGGLGILKQILSRSDQILPNQRFKLYSMAGNLAKFQGDHQTAEKMYERGLAEARSEGDLSDISLLCRGLGGLAAEQADHPTARRFIDEALQAAQQAKDKFGVARSLSMLGDLERSKGHDGLARDLYDQALRTCRPTGRKYATANLLNNLAAAEYGCGHRDSACAHFTEALAMTQESVVKMAGDRVAISYSLDGFAALAVSRGDLATAATLAGAAQHLRDSMNFNIEPAERRFRDGYFASIRERLDEDVYSAAYEKGQRLSLDESVALALRTSNGCQVDS